MEDLKEAVMRWLRTIVTGSLLGILIGAEMTGNTKSPPAPGYDERPEDAWSLCWTSPNQPQGQTGPEMQTLRRQLQILRDRAPIVGRPLVDFAARNGILYLQSPMSGLEGFWKDREGIVRISSFQPKGEEYWIMTLAHETLHAVQHYTGASADNTSWDMPHVQMSRLCYEAAAKVAQYLAALELAQNGEKGPWKSLAASDPDRAAEIVNAFAEASKTTSSQKQVLLETGKIAFAQQFRQQWWLDSYNGQVLTRYIDALAAGRLGPISGDAVYTLGDARKAGCIAPEFNFTAGISRLPRPEDLFGNNPQMQDAFAYVRAEGIGRRQGINHPDYLAARDALERSGNRYRNVNFNVAAARIGKNIDGALEILNDLSSPAPHETRIAGLMPAP